MDAPIGDKQGDVEASQGSGDRWFFDRSTIVLL
jgi:hypothetical protein